MQHHPTPRRGLAMLLVIIAIGMAAILTTAYLASRDNSTVISANASDTTAARWAALSAVDLAVAVLQTKKDWRTGHTDGKLMDDLVLAGATIDVDLVDTATGQPPTAESTEIEITVRASVGALTQIATARATVPTPETLGSIDLDLTEFAIFADDGIFLCDEATISRWEASPFGDLGRRIALGVRASGAASVTICSDAVALDATVYHAAGASTFLIQNNSGVNVQQVEMLDMIPMPAAPASGVDDPGVPQPDLEVIGGGHVVATDARYDRIEVRESELVIAGNIILVADDRMEVRDATITVDGYVRIVVFGALELRDAKIVLADDEATLEIFVGGAVDLRDSYVGPVLPDGTTPDPTGGAGYTDPGRIRVYGMSGAPVPWVLGGSTVFTGILYGPDAALAMGDAAVLYGCVAADRITMRETSAIFYDHMLDTLNGFTVDTGTVFGGDGHLHGGILGLASLDKTDLAALADALDMYVDAGGKRYGDGPAIVPTLDSTSGPTPRTVDVQWEIMSVGVDITDWESQVTVGQSLSELTGGGIAP